NYLFNFLYGNGGDSDTGAPLLVVESLDGSPVALASDGLVSGAPTTLYALGASLDGPVDVLRPGSQYALPFFFRSPGVDTIDITIPAAGPDNSAPVENGTKVGGASPPAAITPAAWDTFWGRIQPRIGSTWGDYVRFLNRLTA